MNRTAYLPLIQNWDDWRPVFTDATLWRPVVQRICQEHGLPAGAVKAGFPGTCAVFVAGGQVVVKLYPPMLPHDFLREREVYGLLHGRFPHIPALLGHGIYPDRTDWPYLLLGFRPGQPIREVHAGLSPANRQALGQELGEMLRGLHALSVVELQHFELTWAAWRAQMAQNSAANLAELRAKCYLPEPVLAAWGQLIAEWRAPPAPLALLNADLTEDHLLLIQEREQWQISALIDWADAEVGEPAYEWIALWYSLCRREAPFFRAILGTYDPDLPLDASFCRQMLVHTLCHRFGAGIIDWLWAQDQPAISTLNDLENWLLPGW